MITDAVRDNKGRFVKGFGPSKDMIKKSGESLKGRPATWINSDKFDEIRNKISKTKKGIPHLNQRGRKHYAWKGGITDENHKIRTSIESRLWRDAVFARDGYTCQKTGQFGGKLRCHHILNFSSHPEIRFAIDNGITLSDEAHKEFHRRYGIKHNTQEQLIEFLNSK